MDVHVRDLRYFLAVARELSFTRAAETLYISQPALSKQIRALERQLRVSLFARESTGARLSRAGSELVPFAERFSNELMLNDPSCAAEYRQLLANLERMAAVGIRSPKGLKSLTPS